MLTIDGLVTGIDTAAIIEGLLSVQQKQIDLLTSRQDKLSQQQSAFKAIEARLLSFRGQLSPLTRSQGNAFSPRAVQVSDETAAVATASSSAAVGTYQIRVDALAANHQVASSGLEDADSLITQGTIDLRVGNGATTTITVDATNNTLQGLADTINFAEAGITATIIQDGSGSGTPYKLLLTGEQTGAANTISITNNLAASSGGETQPTFDTANPVQVAADAVVTLGSGPGAISVQSSKNQVDSLISGVTLNLLAADNTKTITVNVTQDTEPGVAAVQDFVDGYNDLVEFIDEQVKFVGETGQAGLLIGNRTVTDLKNQIQTAILDIVPGLDSQQNRLTAFGISVTDSGRLTLNTNELEQALRGDTNGTSADDVRRLFGLDGQSTHAQISFVLGSSQTQPSDSPYLVDLIQAAERATVTATTSLAASTVIDSSNRELAVTVDGTDFGTLTLDEGTYTTSELSDHLESVINAAAAGTGRSVNVGLNGDQLTITSSSYGNSSTVSVTGGSGLATLGFDGTEIDTGVDVAGTFLVDGVTESATGTGRLLIGNSDNEFTADLQVRVTLTPSQILSGHEAELTVTRGVASRVDQLLGSLLDQETGRIATENQRFDDSLENLQESIDNQQELFTIQQDALIREFVTLESLVSELQNTSSFLAGQLASISQFKK